MDLERPSGLALTGHDDDFCWMELIARSVDGKIVRGEFVRIQDHQRIEEFIRECNRRGVFACSSICIYAEPDRGARYAVPFYLHIHCKNDLEKARECLIQSCEQLAIEMSTIEEDFCLYFDGNSGLDLLVPFQFFDGFYSPWIFPLYAAVSEKHANWNPGLVEQGIYSEEYMCLLPGSRHPGTGLYKVRLSWDEVTKLFADQIRALAASPRAGDSYLEAGIGKYAPWWFTGELKRIEEEITSHSPGDMGCDLGRQDTVSSLVQALEMATLADGTRHRTYRALASYYASLNMDYAEAVARLKVIDLRNPIRDPNDLGKAAQSAFDHPYQSEDDSESQWQSDDGSDMED